MMKRPIKDRLLEKLVPGPNGCWVYIGSKNSSGYGQINEGYTNMSAHRASWEVHVGPIPAEMLVLHKCDYRTCCNPAHLFLGSQLDNMRNRGVKGHKASTRGRNNGNTKLVKADVHDIRRRVKADEPRISIAKAHNISRQGIYNIKIGANWGWLREEP